MSIKNLINDNLNENVFEREKKLNYLFNWMENHNITDDYDFKTGHLRNIIRALKKCGEAENELNHSIIYADKNELEKMCTIIFNNTNKYQENLYSIIKDYVLFYNNKNTIINSFSPRLITFDKINEKTVCDKYVKNLNDLIGCLNEITGDIALKSSFLTARLCVLLLYNGISIETLALLEKTNYNSKDGIISYIINEQKIVIKLDAIIKQELDYYLTLNYLMNSELKTLRLDQDEFLVSYIVREDSESKSLEKRTKAIINKIFLLNKEGKKNICNNKSITPKNIYYAGLFSRTYILELDGISFKETLKDQTASTINEYKKWKKVYYK